MLPKIVIPFYSGSGHTHRVAEKILDGVKTINTNAHLIDISKITEQDWDSFETADGVILGSPTYMGGVAGAFKIFLDESSYRGFWVKQRLMNKMAAGFTVATYSSGDKLNTLMQLAIFAAQHGMIWVNNAGLGSKVSSEDKQSNENGAWLGLMATSIPDKENMISDSDKRTARLFGERFAKSLERWA